MPVSQLLNSVSSREISEWVAYFRIKEETEKERMRETELKSRAEKLRKRG